MNRCTTKPMACLAPLLALPHSAPSLRGFLRGLLVVIGTAFALQTATAQLSSQIRKLPEKVLYGELVVVLPPAVKLNGKDDRLAPGVRILGTDNLLVLSGTLVNKPTKVAYLKDTYGLLHQVWILTEAEIRNGKWD